MVASSSAVSLASVPEVVKKTRASGMPDSAAIALGELDHRPVEVERGGVEDPPGLLGDRLGDLGQRVRGHRGEDAAEEVEVAVAVGVPDVAALAVGDLDRLVVVEREPARQDGPGAGQRGRRCGRRRHGCTSAS